ncbi:MULTISPECIES: hypothetical protein [unclassified Thalassotalea]|uniref:hypothetical protein n=1 Tax=unclassified Thalassotalea TaxID=2614972 RepID=UPI00108026CC|nr:MULTISPECIES: hypothetical protein [unclassified Thalassotalea]NMP16356.1 hypothetical protein [Thalassotalea sp. Y01]QBY03271.1 hypothetical protein E2K93_02295 [Thalassotalea sp. HSM 43]
MDVQLLVTQTDFSIPNLENEMNCVGVNYRIDYIEMHPELVEQYNIKHSPNVLVDGKLVFRYQPSINELKQYFR